MSILLLPVLFVPFVDATSGSSIDVYTKRGGKGAGQASGPFKVGELVVLLAEVKKNNGPAENKLVEFAVYGPPNPYYNLTIRVGGFTNSSGIASNYFRTGPMGSEHWGEIFLGTWRVTAGVELDGEVFTDNMTFECGWDLMVDLFTQRGGEGFYASSQSFKAGEVVTLYMRVANRTVAMPNVLVEFRILLYPNDTYHYVFANESGIAELSYRLPWVIENSSIRGHYALIRFADYVINDYVDFCILAGQRILGDINYDGKVDIRDIAMAALAFGSYPKHPRWNAECDLNNDDDVDIRDLALIAINFGKKYP